MNIQSLGVIGAGQMGTGIAQVCAMSGIAVTLCDLNQDAVDRAAAAIKASLARLAASEKISGEQAQSTVERISTSVGIESLSQVDMVIEVASEDEDIKLALFRQLDEICLPATILASNTSSISITRLASATDRPARVAGMHFMNPVVVMRLVEIVEGLQTDKSVLNSITELAKRIGKVPVQVRDAPGFVANRILLPMINEAIFCLYEKLADAEQIDQIMKLGMSHPMGPLALADLIGLDTCLSILKVLYNDFMDTKYRPCPLLVQMVDAGYLGRKSGRGFYSYAGTKASEGGGS